VATERAATLTELRAVRESLDDLRTVMARQVDEKVDAKVAEVAVPRDEFTRRIRASGKRTVTGLVALLLVVVLGIGLNRVTLLQAQRELGEQVTRCFLRPGAVTAAEATACDKRFSPQGHEYLKLQERSAQANRRFADLQRWAESKGWQPPR